jgi:alpha-1,3-glucosyltransferase
MCGWHVVEGLVPPPTNKPDLWTVANVGIGAVGFSICYLWCFWRLLKDSDLLPSGTKEKKLKTK